jgi:hypothetical protein
MSAHQQLINMMKKANMTSTEFNEKWVRYLTPRHYGMAISDTRVLEYMDSEFEAAVLKNPDFRYAQIKMKFDTARVYTNSYKNGEWELMINKLIK